MARVPFEVERHEPPQAKRTNAFLVMPLCLACLVAIGLGVFYIVQRSAGAVATCDLMRTPCGGATVNEGNKVTCSGDVASCDESTCCKAAALKTPKAKTGEEAAQAKCLTLTEAQCGAGKIKDITKSDQDCVANPCTETDDAQTCCEEADPEPRQKAAAEEDARQKPVAEAMSKRQGQQQAQWLGIKRGFPGGAFASIVAEDQRQCKVQCEKNAQCQGMYFSGQECLLYDRTCFLYGKPCGTQRLGSREVNVEQLERRGQEQEDIIRDQVCAALDKKKPRALGNKKTKKSPVQPGGPEEITYTGSLSFSSVEITSKDEDLRKWGGQMYEGSSGQMAVCKKDGGWFVKVVASGGQVTEHKVTGVREESHMSHYNLCLMVTGRKAIYVLTDHIRWSLAEEEPQVNKECGEGDYRMG